MSSLIPHRIARWAKGSHRGAEYANLESLIDEEAVKVSDGYHQARWIVPLVGLAVSLACFVPLALTVHPLFWVGVAGMSALGLSLGAVFHALARRISPTQLALRKRCIALAAKLNSARSLLGLAPVIAPEVGQVLDEGAKLYLRARPNAERDPHSGKLGASPADAWSEARAKAQRALDEGMAQLLSLAEPDSVSAQEGLLAQGWARPLLEEMQATAAALSKQKIAAQISGARLHPVSSSISELADARAQLERLDAALQELGTDSVTEQNLQTELGSSG